MNRHISTEQLSAYLDSELGFAEVGPLEAHCATCGECGARLASLRRVVQADQPDHQRKSHGRRGVQRRTDGEQ